MDKILTYAEFINENLHLFERNIENIEGNDEQEYEDEDDDFNQKDLNQMIKRFKNLNDELNTYRKQFEEEIKPLVDEQEDLGDEIIRLMEKFGTKKIEAENLIAKYQEPRKQEYPSYKKAFEAALEKVNDSTRKALLEIKKYYTTIAEHRAKVRVKDTKNKTAASKKFGSRYKTKIEENLIKKGIDKIKDLIKNMYNSLFKSYNEYEEAVEELEQVVNS